MGWGWGFGRRSTHGWIISLLLMVGLFILFSRLGWWSFFLVFFIFPAVFSRVRHGASDEYDAQGKRKNDEGGWDEKPKTDGKRLSDERYLLTDDGEIMSAGNEEERRYDGYI